MSEDDLARNLLAQEPGREQRHANAARIPNIAQTHVTRYIGADHREASDAYRGEIFRRGRFRVVACPDGLQWIVQRRRAKETPGGAAWDAVAYCATRKALVRFYRANAGADAPEIAALPEHISRGARA